MGELGSGTGTSYPTDLDTNSSVEVNSPSANKTKARAQVPNDHAAAILAIETELGLLPKGALASVRARLDALDAITQDIPAINSYIEEPNSQDVRILPIGCELNELQQDIDDLPDTDTDTITNMKLVSATYDVSTATGTQAITGAGFTPNFVMFFASAQTPTTSNTSVGWHDGTDDYCQYDEDTPVSTVNLSKCIVYEIAGGNAQADVQSLDADGCTLSWVKTSSPTGTLNIAIKFIKY